MPLPYPTTNERGPHLSFGHLPLEGRLRIGNILATPPPPSAPPPNSVVLNLGEKDREAELLDGIGVVMIRGKVHDWPSASPSKALGVCLAEQGIYVARSKSNNRTI
jgi:hypothetical protein